MIDVKNLKKSFGDVHVLKGITTHVNKGECICIIGPSGSGKSTFLRCLNLLEKPEEGEITVNGQQLLDPKLDVDKFRENVGMVFQHFNLFPNMTVLKNITLAPVRLGYRAKYICAAARQVASGAVDLEAVRHMDYAHAKAELLRLTGVGIKVAECICLFALHHIDAFPVDTHIRQMLDAHYPKGFPLKRYKGFAGVMQQYAFYYELSLKG